MNYIEENNQHMDFINENNKQLNMQTVLEGDLSKLNLKKHKIRLRKFKKEEERKRKFGERIYNYSKFTEETTNNNGKGTKLYVSGCYYWKHKKILFISLLSRQMFSYNFDYDRTRTFTIDKVEEIRTRNFFSKMNIFKSLLGKNKFFFMVIQQFNIIKVYDFIHLDNEKTYLEENIKNENLKYRVKIHGVITNSHMFRGGLGYSTQKNNVYLVKQVESEKFVLVKKVSLYQKFRNTTISAICYGSSTNLVLLGTTIGDFYVYDIDISKVVFTYRDSNCKIIKIKFCEALKNIYIFWENHKAKVLDSSTYKVIQEVDDLEARGKSNYVYMTNIDNIINSPITISEKERKSGGSTVAKFSESIAKPIRWNRLMGEMRRGNINVIFGGSMFSIYQLHVRADKEFKEIINNFKGMSQAINTSNTSKKERREFFQKIAKNSYKWIMVGVNDLKDSLIMINEKKFLMYYNLKDDLIVKHSMIDIHGEIIKMEVSNDGKRLILANRTGDYVVYNLNFMSKMLEIKVPLSSVLWVEKLEETYELVYFNSPDEVICLKKIKGVRQIYDIEKLELGKNMDAFRLTSPLLLVRSFSNYIICFQENFKMVVFKKKNMKVMKEFDLLEHIREKDLKRKSGSDYYQYIEEVKLVNSVFYIHFDAGRMLILKLNEKSITDLTINTQLVNYDFKMGVDKTGHKFFALNSSMNVEIFEYKSENFISLKELKELKGNKDLMKKFSSYKKSKSNSIGLRDLASKVLNKSGEVLERVGMANLYELLRNRKLSYGSKKTRKKLPASFKKVSKAMDLIMDSSNSKSRTGSVVSSPQGSVDSSLASPRATIKYSDIKEILYVDKVDKLAIIMNNGPFYVIDKDFTNIKVVNLLKKLTRKKTTENRNMFNLKMMMGDRRRTMIRKKTTLKKEPGFKDLMKDSIGGSLSSKSFNLQD